MYMTSDPHSALVNAKSVISGERKEILSLEGDQLLFFYQNQSVLLNLYVREKRISYSVSQLACLNISRSIGWYGLSPV